MMNYKLIFGLIVSLSISSISARADSIANYDDWKLLTDNEKQVYLMAVWSFMTTMIDSESEDVVFSIGLTNCAKAVFLHGQMLQELVDESYRKNTSLWKVPPVAVGFGTIHNFCLDYINAERRRNRLEKLPAWEGY